MGVLTLVQLLDTDTLKLVYRGHEPSKYIVRRSEIHFFKHLKHYWDICKLSFLLYLDLDSLYNKA